MTNRERLLRPVFCLCVLASFAATVAIGQEPYVTLGSDDAPASRSRVEIRDSTNDILSSPEFQHFQRLQGRHTDSLDDKPEPVPASTYSGPSLGAASGIGSLIGVLGQLLVWGLVAAVVVLMVVLAGKALGQWEPPSDRDTGLSPEVGDAEDDEDVAPGELSADECLRRAREFARAGAFRDAIAQLLLGAMSRMERDGLIRNRRGLTFRDYLRAIRDSSEQHAAFRSIVRTYEPLGFGRRDATQAHFDHSLTHYESNFQKNT